MVDFWETVDGSVLWCDDDTTHQCRSHDLCVCATASHRRRKTLIGWLSDGPNRISLTHFLYFHYHRQADTSQFEKFFSPWNLPTRIGEFIKWSTCPCLWKWCYGSKNGVCGRVPDLLGMARKLWMRNKVFDENFGQIDCCNNFSSRQVRYQIRSLLYYYFRFYFFIINWLGSSYRKLCAKFLGFSNQNKHIWLSVCP